MHIQIETPDQPDVAALFAQLQDLHARLYPAAAGTALPLASMLQPEVRFLVARDDSRRAVGCVALVLRGEHGELRRMVVDEAARRQGVGSALLEALVLQARAAGVRLLKLTTGVHQHAALALYERFGFIRCAPYGGNGADPLEVCMEMPL
ncbi:GNAT family N-acetyltransferase [Massilia niabensis]|uniref:GNAT family N-acetyltransferase n=1 Tax=Massilia niabensis TaxID=544910 RepID=A0ABW0L1E4_9BURK